MKLKLIMNVLKFIEGYLEYLGFFVLDEIIILILILILIGCTPSLWIAKVFRDQYYLHAIEVFHLICRVPP